MMLMLCPICAGEFQPGAPSCPACGCNLVASTLNDDDAQNENNGESFDFVELCRSRAYPVAMLIKQTLEQNGVPVVLHGGNISSVIPSLAFGGELRLLVPRHQLDYARELHKAYFEANDETDFDSEDHNGDA